MIVLQDQPWPVVAAVVIGLIGIACWIASWTVVRDVWRRKRLSDFGSVLIFGGMLTRYAALGGPKNALEWMLCALAVVFLGIAMWGLFKTQNEGPDGPGGPKA